MFCRLFSVATLPLLLQFLRFAVGLALSSHASVVAPLPAAGDAADGQALHMTRSEMLSSEAAIDRTSGSHTYIQMLESGAMQVMKKKDPAPTHPPPLDTVPGHTVGQPVQSAQSLLSAGGDAQLKDRLKVAAKPAGKELNKKISAAGAGSKFIGKAAGIGSLPDGQMITGFEDKDVLRPIPTRDGIEWKEPATAKEDALERSEKEISDGDWDDEGENADMLDDRGSGQDPFDADVSSTVDDSYVDGDGSAYDASNMPMVNVTAEEDATAPANSGTLKAESVHAPQPVPAESNVEKLGEGIGAMAYERSPTGSRNVNRDLRKRLQIQDLATVTLLITAFVATIVLSCSSVYQVAHDPSPAAYYSEPRGYQQRVICETNDADAFLLAFNTQPQNARLRITGRNPEPGGFRRFLRTLNAHTTQPRGLAALLPMRQRRRQSVLFDVSLDLSPFITAGDARVSDENMMILQKYLNTNNHLESILIQKHVDWPLWEDVATNIRQRLRTLGFPGDVEVRFEAQDELLVYQNQKWSNFVRNRVTQALVVISIFGAAFWLPYVWVRSKTTKVETRFRINVDPARYWELVQEGLNAAEGFHAM